MLSIIRDCKGTEKLKLILKGIRVDYQQKNCNRKVQYAYTVDAFLQPLVLSVLSVVLPLYLLIYPLEAIDCLGAAWL
jgi:hypothetical protein